MFLPIMAVWIFLAVADASEGRPRLPSPPILPAPPGEPQGVPRPPERHSPSRVSEASSRWDVPVSGQRHVEPNCCDKGSDSVNQEIIKCYEQKRGPACAKHFYIVEVQGGKRYCINPNSKWLDDMKKQKNLYCSS